MDTVDFRERVPLLRAVLANIYSNDCVSEALPEKIYESSFQEEHVFCCMFFILLKISVPCPKEVNLYTLNKNIFNLTVIHVFWGERPLILLCPMDIQDFWSFDLREERSSIQSCSSQLLKTNDLRLVDTFNNKSLR